MPTCPQCTTEVDPTARLCPHCGTQLPAASDPSTLEAPSQPTAPQTPPSPAASPPSGPAASGLSDRNWAVIAHLSALVPLLIGIPLTFLGPLVLWLIVRERHTVALDHAVEALNFNISWLLWSLIVIVAGAVAAIPTAGLGLIPMALVLVGLALAWLILVIIAAVKASTDTTSHYPLTVRFIST